MLRAITAIGVLLLCAACTKTGDYLRDTITKHSDFVDPGSAIFRNVTHRAYIWEAWCGEVNVKNRMGGYAGWSPFHVTTHKNGKVFVSAYDPTEVHDDSPEAKLHELMCRDAQPAPTWITPFFRRFDG